MNTRAAAPVAITVSLVALLSGCAGAAAQGGQVRDDLRPAANAASQVFVNDRVVVADRLEQAIKRSTPVQQAPVVADRLEQAIKRSQSSTTHQFSPAQIRELKGTGPAEVHDDLSPLGNGTSIPDEPSDTVGDDLSPLGGSH